MYRRNFSVQKVTVFQRSGERRIEVEVLDKGVTVRYRGEGQPLLTGSVETPVGESSRYTSSQGVSPGRLLYRGFTDS